MVIELLRGDWVTNMSKKINNQGFSLVELIVIMVIIVILATAVVVSFVNTESQKVKNSTTLISKYLDSTISHSMTRAKDTVYLRIVYDGDDSSGHYKIEDSEGHDEKLPSGVVLEYHTDKCAIGEKYEIKNRDNKSLELSYSRTNGSGPMIGKVEGSTFVPDNNGQENVDYIYISSGSTTKTIKMNTKTGVYEIDPKSNSSNTTNATNTTE